MNLPILTLEALDDLAGDISPGPWSMDDRLEYVDGNGDPLLTDNGAVIYQPDEDLFLAAPAVLATARALYAERDDDDRWEREAPGLLAAIREDRGPLPNFVVNPPPDLPEAPYTAPPNRAQRRAKRRNQR